MLTRALIFSAALAFSALPAVAGQEAEALIASTATRISDPSSGQDAFRASIDVPVVARFTLGKYANRISDDERQRFTTAFDTFLANTFVEHSDSFTNARVEVVGSVDRSDKDSIVETRVTPKNGEAMTVRWRVMLRDGAWRVVDVEVLGLWLAIEQRAQIAAIMDKPRATIEDAIKALNS
ncbi:MAG: ABC transporter substrate-binding protein [Hyphomonas sp.]|nr:ABC transporter substrate-binding protein [Hyphomonas sp.]MDP3460765.1 ABC transporter substrate-binding protein [Hyphomonas sp.]